MEEKILTQEEINSLSARARAEYMKSIEHEIDDDMDPLEEDEDILEEEEELAARDKIKSFRPLC